MAILLGGLIIVGIDPGVAMVTDHLDLVYLIIWSIAVANVFGAGLAFLLSPQIARLTTVRYVLLAPFMFGIVFFAAFQATRGWGDLIALFLLSVLGVYMKRFGWSRPALLIGFVLSDQVESSVYQTVALYGASFLERPIVIALLLLTLLSVAAAVFFKAGNRVPMTERSAFRATKTGPQWLFFAAVTVFAGYVLWDAQAYNQLTGLYPTVAACTALACLLPLGLNMALRTTAGPSFFDAEHDGDAGGGNRLSAEFFPGPASGHAARVGAYRLRSWHCAVHLPVPLEARAGEGPLRRARSGRVRAVPWHSVGPADTPLSHRTFADLSRHRSALALAVILDTRRMHSLPQPASGGHPSIDATLAHYIAAAVRVPLPDAVGVRARCHLLDTLAAILSGRFLAAGAFGYRFVESLGAQSGATLLGGSRQSSVEYAAFANAMAAHADETDDSHVRGRFHPGCGVIPAAIAVAENRKASSDALLRAIALGYDVGARSTIALGFSNPRTTTFSTHAFGTVFGAAASSGALMGLSPKQAEALLSFTVQQVSGLSYWNRDPDHVEKSFDFGGKSARNGVFAALLAEAGMTAPDHPLTGPRSYLEAYAETPRQEASRRGAG